MKAKSEETVALREDAEAGNRLAGGLPPGWSDRGAEVR